MPRPICWNYRPSATVCCAVGRLWSAASPVFPGKTAEEFLTRHELLVIPHAQVSFFDVLVNFSFATSQFVNSPLLQSALGFRSEVGESVQ